MYVLCHHRQQATVLKPTQPQPFRLQTEARGALHEHEMAAKLAADEARAKRLRRVTARPLPVTLDVPAMPAKPEPKSLTLPDPFPLKSLVSSASRKRICSCRLQTCSWAVACKWPSPINAE